YQRSAVCHRPDRAALASRPTVQRLLPHIPGIVDHSICLVSLSKDHCGVSAMVRITRRTDGKPSAPEEDHQLPEPDASGPSLRMVRAMVSPIARHAGSADHNGVPRPRRVEEGKE